jgi:hypothetical protein
LSTIFTFVSHLCSSTTVEKHGKSHVKKHEISKNKIEGEYPPTEMSHPQANVVKTSANDDSEPDSTQSRISYADVVRKKLGRKVSAAVIKTAVGAKGPTAVNNTALKQ